MKDIEVVDIDNDVLGAINLVVNAVQEYNNGDLDYYEDIMGIIEGMKETLKESKKYTRYYKFLNNIIRSKLFFSGALFDSRFKSLMEKADELVINYREFSKELNGILDNALEENDYSRIDDMYITSLKICYMLGFISKYYDYIREEVEIACGYGAHENNSVMYETNINTREIQTMLKSLGSNHV